MIHLGDITKIDGKRIDPVDVIVGGSPCQDLSVAGKRAGLAGERSGLFMEQIRLTKELRQQDAERGKPAHLCRPRYFVWENVPGAFSSKKGEDFAAVFEEVIRVIEPKAPPVSVPEKGWPTAGCIYDDMGRWSVAWRVHDAQFWGVPQRRRRIALVADFGGMSAPEILFERKGLRRDPAPSGEARKGATDDAERGFGGASRTYNIGSYHSNAWKSDNPHSGVYETEFSKTLDALNCGYPACNQGGTAVVCMATQQGGAEVRTDDRAQTLTAAAGMSGNNQPVVFDGSRRHDYQPFGDVAETIQAHYGTGGGNTPLVCENAETTLCMQNTVDRPAVYDAKARGIGWEEELSPTLRAGVVPGVVSAVTLEPGIAAREGGTAIVAIHQNASGELKTSTKGYTLGTTSNASARNTPMIFDARGNGDGKVTCTLTGDHENRVTDYTVLLAFQGFGGYKESGIASTCKSRDYKNATDLVVSGIDARNGAENGDLCGTLQAKPNGGFSYNCIHPVRINKSVRRLTPLECERLQGYPDGWTDIGEWIDSKGKRHDSSDSARYKALGNSIALPFWRWLMRRISAQYVGTPTLGSLFDGIGGFPLCWERINGKGTALWASEIEEFPIAVTKYHFGG